VGAVARQGPKLNATSLALRFDDDDYHVADLLLLALAERSWQALEDRLARGLALAREHGRGVAPARVSDEVRRFRYQRRLISGKELRDWLEARALELAELHRYCLRRVLVEEHGMTGERADPGEPAAALYAEAICDGTLARAGARAGELAAMAAACDARADPAAAQVDRLVAEAEHRPRAGLDGIAGDELRRRAAAVVSLLGAEAAFIENTATRDAIRRHVAQHGLDWVRVECAELTFAGEGAAREAMLCLRVDGVPVARLAERIGITIRSGSHFVGDLDERAAPLAASVAIGDPLGPFPHDGGWLVLVVERRLPPSAQDPELVDRATSAIVRAACERVKAGRVRELATF